MSDIVERLREAHPNSAQRFAGSIILLDAAAAVEERDRTIQRLRAEVTALQSACARLMDEAIPSARAEAFERAAQIADAAKEMRERLFAENGASINASKAVQAEEIAAAIRAEATGEGSEGC